MAIIHASRFLGGGFKLRLRNGFSSFWYDNWSHDRLLTQLVPYVYISDSFLRVCDVWVENSWNLSQLATPLPQPILDSLRKVNIWLHPDAQDCVVWAGDISGSYSVASAYKWLCGSNMVQCDSD